MIDLLHCNWSQANFLIFSNNVYDPLIYYSHLLPLISSIILGLFVFFSNRKLLINKLFFILTILFSVWVYFDLILWATGNMEYEMFFWSIMLPVEFLIFVAAFFLTKEFIGGGKISKIYKVLFSLFFVPILLFTQSKYALVAFDFTNCDRGAIEGPLWKYLYVIEGIIFLTILGEVIYAIVKDKDKIHKRKTAIFSGGDITFLGLFIIGNVTIIQNMGWGYEQYKLFGMLGFLLVLVFLIVRFKTFDIKLIGAQALVWSLVILVGSEFFFVTRLTSQILVGVTLVVSGILGLILVRSVKKEVSLNESLEVANAGQKNLIHIMNHQIKGYLSISKNIFAELLTDDYGKVPEEARGIIAQGLESSDKGQKYVTTILRGASAENGTLTYDMKSMDFKNIVSEVVLKEKEIAEKKGLKLATDMAGGDYNMIGDSIQLGETVRNLIENSIYYTPTGSVSINLKRKDDKIIFSVKDTGVGIKEEDRNKIFKVGGVSNDSIKINTNSSGYGLAFVKGIVEKHKGKVWFESAGYNKGSTFFIELPVK